ncbi:Hypothetical protein NTJ_05987 [Nesidiocoris tenuis]|uniref:ATP synthase subunit s, mitochondrial n=1 Tax=Nesidiocoris tenuis TaxID=355587 RepID=A0ABN7ALR8_9HEMI|nr:Hypothetical protein NTJ_05987 [Nesidiocoris tenuis]
MTSAAVRRLLQNSRCRFSTSAVLNREGFSAKERRLMELAEKRREEEIPWFLRVFASFHKKIDDRHYYDPTKFSIAKFRAWREQIDYEAEVLSQSYVEERHQTLGSDLASAHFIVFRQGKIKFVGNDRWIEKEPSAKECPDLPCRFDNSYYVEAIDASNTEIRYEGLANLVDLQQLKWISFRNCKRVDDWFVDRLTHILEPKVEHLDLSHCPGLTEKCLSCFYRLPQLKKLVLEGVAETPAFKLGCLELEDAMPGLELVGVDYSLPKAAQPQKNVETFTVRQASA